MSSLTPVSLGLDRFSSYRPGQEDLIWSLASSTCRFTGLNAPPGTGKSLVSISTAKVLNSRLLYLVITKNLGRQLMHDFESSGLYNINGHINYPCASSSRDRDDEDDVEVECTRGEQCLYGEACQTSLSHQMVVTNYAHWTTLAKSGMPDKLGQFDVLVLDEAHNILPRMTDYLTIKITAKTISRYLHISFPSFGVGSAILNQWRDWAKELIPLVRQQYRSLVDSRADKRDIRRITKLGSDLKRFITDQADWIVKQDRPDQISFVPLDISQYMEQYLFRGIQRIILVSGTLFEEDLKSIGIVSDFEYKEISSPFPAQNRPIYYFPSSPPVRVSYNMSKAQRIIWQNHVDRISQHELALHNNGIVHTRSYKRSLEMVSQSKIPHDCLMTHTAQETHQAIIQFKNNDRPVVMFSPAIEEGVDFPYDTCRFQIIPKIPFLDPNEVITKARLERDKTYGDRETARTIIQECGRIVRAPDDYGRTYITDGHWEWFRKKKYFYKWFRSAFRTIYNLSEVK